MVFQQLALGLLLGIEIFNVWAQTDPQAKKHHCIESSNELGPCERGCVPGFYGMFCNKTCSNYCTGACCQDTGHCLTGCKHNWYTSNCTKQCVGKCKNDTCDMRSGDCMNGCMDGFYDRKCDKKCSANCIEGVCDINGGCHCPKGVDDKSCYIDCDNCMDGHCDMNSNGQLTCLKGCPKGRTGMFCQEWCRGECSECDSDGLCIQDSNMRRNIRDLQSQCCPDGLTGTKCNIECTNCIYFKRNNTCVSSCAGGYHGTECHLNCSDKCSKGTSGKSVCDKSSSVCHSGCVQGYFGDTCFEKCGQNCSREICFQNNGSCMECISNKYGSHCEDDCGKCKDRRCERDGSCVCKLGWYGKRCIDKCEDNCKKNDCRIDTDGNHICVGECIVGYSGDDCLSKCPRGCEQGCDREKNTCYHTHVTKGHPTIVYMEGKMIIVVATLLTIILVILIGVGILYLIRNQGCRKADLGQNTVGGETVPMKTKEDDTDNSEDVNNSDPENPANIPNSPRRSVGISDQHRGGEESAKLCLTSNSADYQIRLQ